MSDAELLRAWRATQREIDRMAAKEGKDPLEFRAELEDIERKAVSDYARDMQWR
jgi:hypothetical protein